MRKDDLRKLLKRVIITFSGSAVLGTVLLVLVFCIPADRIKENVASSLDEMLPSEQEIREEEPLLQYIKSRRELFTDAIMVQNASEKAEGKNAFEHAMWIYHHDLSEEGWTPEVSVKAYVRDIDTDKMFLREYSRYWHGYLIFLRPLLFFCTWSQAAVISAILQISLLIAIAAVAWQKKKGGVVFMLAGGMIFMKPFLVISSFAMSVCWYITLTAVLIMLLFHDKLEKGNWYPIFFFAIGIAVAYFDFLTYPIVTVGFPLCVYFLIKKKETLRRQLAKTVGLPVCWGIGYAAFWACKWVLAEVTLHSGTIRNAAASLFGWSDVVGGRPRLNGLLYTLKMLLEEYDSWLYPVLAGILAAAAVILAAAAALKSSFKELLTRIVPFAVIFLGPAAWLMIVQHHSAQHTPFTFRMLSVSVAALCCAAVTAIRLLREKKSEFMENKSCKRDNSML